MFSGIFQNSIGRGSLLANWLKIKRESLLLLLVPLVEAVPIALFSSSSNETSRRICNTTPTPPKRRKVGDIHTSEHLSLLGL